MPDGIGQSSDWSEGYFRAPLPRLPGGYPMGWMSWLDLQVLYNATLMCTGPILEVGPFVGRSTTAIAAGLRDRSARTGDAATAFDTIDYGIASPAEWESRFNESFDPGKRGGRVKEAITLPGGTIAALIDNLKARDLLSHVTTILRGDIHTAPISRRYGLIFCDANHDEGEIRRNVPRLADLAAPGCRFVFDDIVTEAHGDLISDLIGARRYVLTRALRPEAKPRCKLMIAETG